MQVHQVQVGEQREQLLFNGEVAQAVAGSQVTQRKAGVGQGLGVIRSESAAQGAHEAHLDAQAGKCAIPVRALGGVKFRAVRERLEQPDPHCRALVAHLRCKQGELFAGAPHDPQAHGIVASAAGRQRQRRVLGHAIDGRLELREDGADAAQVLDGHGALHCGTAAGGDRANAMRQ